MDEATYRRLKREFRERRPRAVLPPAVQALSETDPDRKAELIDESRQRLAQEKQTKREAYYRATHPDTEKE